MIWRFGSHYRAVELLPEEEAIIGPDDDDGPDDTLPADLWFNAPTRR